MKSQKYDFSIIIPTYTGEEFIEDCFHSILKQLNLADYNFEIIVVIDGPSRALKEIAERNSDKFISEGIGYRIEQFSSNRGRFAARLEGAKMASSNQLLFIDDRNTLAPDYFKQVLGAKKKALIPNVLENNHPNFIAKTVYLIRMKVYGGKWGTDFTSYDIKTDNFEKSSKGTTSFWIDKKIFLEVCNKISRQQANLKEVNDDTKVMKEIVDNYTPIFKSSEAKIFYQPRQGVFEELHHFYHRGPRFVDYYLKPGTRFFLPIILFFLSLFLVLSALIIVPALALYITGFLMLVLLLTAAYLANFGVSTFQTMLGLLLIGVSFGAGMMKGLWVKLR